MISKRFTFLAIAGLLLCSIPAYALNIGDLRIDNKAGEPFSARVPLELKWDGFSTLAGSITGFHRYIDLLDYAVKKIDDKVYLIIQAPKAFTEPFSLTLSMTYREQRIAREYRIEPLQRKQITKVDRHQPEKIATADQPKDDIWMPHLPVATQAANSRPSQSPTKHTAPLAHVAAPVKQPNVATSQAREEPLVPPPPAGSYVLKSIHISANVPVLAPTPVASKETKQENSWYPRAMRITLEQAIQNNQGGRHATQ